DRRRLRRSRRAHGAGPRSRLAGRANHRGRRALRSVRARGPAWIGGSAPSDAQRDAAGDSSGARALPLSARNRRHALRSTRAMKRLRIVAIVVLGLAALSVAKLVFGAAEQPRARSRTHAQMRIPRSWAPSAIAPLAPVAPDGGALAPLDEDCITGRVLD